MSLAGFFKFLGGAFSELNGCPSFSRLATGAIVAFSLFWVTWIVVHSSQLPDLSELALFITTLYGTNKLSSAFKGADKSTVTNGGTEQNESRGALPVAGN